MRASGLSGVVGWLVAMALGACGVSALAEQPASPNPEVEQKAAFEAAAKALVRGPAQLPFGNQAKLQMPDGFVFIPVAEATRLMKSMGNPVESGFQGLVVPRSQDCSFSFFGLNYESSGYIKDDDAKDWDAAKLLGQIRDGTAEGNKRRSEMGIGELEITGWIQPPKYESGAHQVVWSVGVREKGAAPSVGDGLNYKTLVLGREGYMSMNLVTDQAHLDGLRPAVATLLNGLTFNDGKRYADFNSGTDHVAEFGLAALIAGVAAKKLGLIALIVAFVVKFSKVIIIAVAGVALAFRKKLGLSRKEPPAAPPAAAPPPEAPPAAAAPTDTA
ncbi:MAG TPA: DUF2167 domain-containing protein [Burkholderiaceae bacterium]|nr:DUF2167 domain-containing protein [Burkholderiaceae bacterium]